MGLILLFLIQLFKRLWFMGTSDITVSALVAVPRVQGNKLQWTVTDNWPKGSQYSLGAVEVWASLTNNRATATKVGEGLTDFLHTGLDEEVIWYYWVKARNKVGVGSYGPWNPVLATAGVPGQTLGQAGIGFTLQNGKLVASVSGNALTIAVKTAAGTDPSASDPVYVAFRSATLSTGGYVTRKITAALSLVISSGSTLGAANSTPFRVWIVLLDDAGTLRLAVKNCSGTQSINSLDETNVFSATAEGGAGGADSQGIMYGSVSVSSKAGRIVGFIDWNSGLSTAGTWSAAPDLITMYGPGIKQPGDIVQVRRILLGTSVSGVGTIPLDNSKPQLSEGDAFANQFITPTSPVNWLEHEILLHFSADAADVCIAALFKDSDADAIAAAAVGVSGINFVSPCVLAHRHVALSNNSQQYSIRVGITPGGPATGYRVNYIDALPSGTLFNGTSTYRHYITEIMA